jgi:hypothetical protein
MITAHRNDHLTQQEKPWGVPGMITPRLMITQRPGHGLTMNAGRFVVQLVRRRMIFPVGVGEFPT